MTPLPRALRPRYPPASGANSLLRASSSISSVDLFLKLRAALAVRILHEPFNQQVA